MSRLAAGHPVDHHVGQLIRLRRRELGMPIVAFADACNGVTYQQIQKYETGENRISVSTLVGIASVLGVEPGYFLKDAPGAMGGRAPSGPAEEGLRLLAAASNSMRLLRAFAELSAPQRNAVVALVELMTPEAADPAIKREEQTA